MAPCVPRSIRNFHYTRPSRTDTQCLCVMDTQILCIHHCLILEMLFWKNSKQMLGQHQIKPYGLGMRYRSVKTDEQMLPSISYSLKQITPSSSTYCICVSSLNVHRYSSSVMTEPAEWGWNYWRLHPPSDMLTKWFGRGARLVDVRWELIPVEPPCLHSTEQGLLIGTMNPAVELIGFSQGSLSMGNGCIDSRRCDSCRFERPPSRVTERHIIHLQTLD